MPNLKDNLKQWRDSARIDWFSQFIKAWIPFNAWMTDTYGDLSERELLDRVKNGSNVIYNRIVPMLTWNPAQARGTQGGWQDNDQEAEEFRLNVELLHIRLQRCLVAGRRGRVSFETVDVGSNPHVDEHLVVRTRTLRVRRNYPERGNVTLEVSETRTTQGFAFTQLEYDRRALEDAPPFQTVNAEYRAKLLAMHERVAPRRVMSVLAEPDSNDSLRFGGTRFVQDPAKIFSALVDVTYNLRNALFHGSITPNEQHNEIYEPAYHLVMRFVKCTI
jgi:hypothetical protein